MTNTIFVRVESEAKSAALAQAVADIRDSKPSEATHILTLTELSNIPLAPFAYWVSEPIRKLFTSFSPLEGQEITVKQGLATADDFRFVRLAWETPIEIPGKSNRSWFPLAKGGSYSPFYADVFLKVNWGRNGEEIRFFGAPTGIKPKSRPQNISFYFRPGLTWPLRTTSGLALRAMPAGCVFGHKGPAVFHQGNTNKNLLPLLAITMSQPFHALVSLQLAATAAAARSYEVGVIQRTVVPDVHDSKLADLARAAWVAKRRPDTANLTSGAFLAPALALPDCTISAGITAWSAILSESASALATAQAEIDNVAFELYGLGEDDHRTVERMLALQSKDGQKTGENNDDQDAEGEDPSTVDGTTPVAELLEYALGTSFGRWDIRCSTGERQPPELPAPFDPLPVCPPGMLQNADGLPAAKEDVPDDYPLPITWPGILVSDPGHPEDIIARVRDALAVIWKDHPEAIEEEACQILKVKLLRDYLNNSNKFFADHLKRYTKKSRRQAPVYWPLSTESGAYTLWIYYHRLTTDTLFMALREFVQPRLQTEELFHGRVQQETSANPSPENRQKLAESEKLLGALRSLETELKRVAPLFKPDLNDGVIINSAPLWRMIPHSKWQKDCKACWDKLVKGDYDWAHLAMHLWPERVVPKCQEDRSLAIAHGLDEVFWLEDAKGKVNPTKTKQSVIDELIAERSSPAVKAALEDLLSAPAPAGTTKKRARRKKTV